MVSLRNVLIYSKDVPLDNIQEWQTAQEAALQVLNINWLIKPVCIMCFVAMNKWLYKKANLLQ